jgi:hypothetical protein
VRTAMTQGGEGGGGVAEGAETSLLYVRFRAAAPELRPLMEEMETRARGREYQQVRSFPRPGLLRPLVPVRGYVCDVKLTLVGDPLAFACGSKSKSACGRRVRSASAPTDVALWQT